MAFLFIVLITLFLFDIARSIPTTRTESSGWRALTRLPQPRQEHGVAVLDNNTIAIVAGTFISGDISNITGLTTTDSMQLYDITSNTWREAASTPVRVNHPNIAALDGRLYLLGGLIESRDDPDLTFNWVASGESFVYDPITDLWDQLRPMPNGTERGSAVVSVYGEMIYLAGGMTVLREGYQDAVTLVTAFNTTSRRWQRLSAAVANIPDVRQHATGTIVDDTFYVIGGRGFSANDVQSTVFSLDLTNQSAGWMANPQTMPVPRGGLSGEVVDGQFYTFGGEGNLETANGVFDEVEVFDLRTQSWRELEPMAVPRHGTRAVVVNNNIYIPGGSLQAGGRRVEVDGAVSYYATTDYFDCFEVRRDYAVKRSGRSFES